MPAMSAYLPTAAKKGALREVLEGPETALARQPGNLKALPGCARQFQNMLQNPPVVKHGADFRFVQPTDRFVKRPT